MATRDEDPRSLYTHVLYDSDIEKDFVERLENDEEVRLYVKLPGWFTVDTPLGGYNPDWAILMEKDDIKKLYFVVETKGSLQDDDLRRRVETKGSLQDDDLRRRERDKIRCARKHFKVLESGVSYEVATDFDEIKDSI